jgi:acyl carrier protein
MNADRSRDVARRIRGVFVKSLSLNLNPDEDSVPSNLTSVAALDSLAMLELVAGLESEFGREIDPERLTIAFLGDLDALTEYFS